ncbi:unnamed protein product [Bursaphelenchus okinawaensis]|uniref:Uncharacterized protein n=1 Tax=Bursaphelenchus okinawaensis TaxID=465554 RepID=A0A811LPI5_9BILA|nr:unnamed protein product [Bursaphelenchus okinawaensis]CAG9127187.1 unnamed protein product [Bursaphelenchus okinawaensis]
MELLFVIAFCIVGLDSSLATTDSDADTKNEDGLATDSDKSINNSSSGNWSVILDENLPFRDDYDTEISSDYNTTTTDITSTVMTTVLSTTTDNSTDFTSTTTETSSTTTSTTFSTTATTKTTYVTITFIPEVIIPIGDDDDSEDDEVKPGGKFTINKKMFEAVEVGSLVEKVGDKSPVRRRNPKNPKAIRD